MLCNCSIATRAFPSPMDARLVPGPKCFCPMCHTFAAVNLKGVLRHVGACHAYEANFNVVCGLDGCPRTYKNYHGYKKHLYRKHKHLLDDLYVQQSRSVNYHPQVADSNENDDVDLPISSVQTYDAVKQSALFLLKGTAIGKLSKSSTDLLVQDIPNLLAPRLESLKLEISTALKSKGVDVDGERERIFERSSLNTPFHGIHSEFLRRKFYVDQLGFVEPVERKLGEKVVETVKNFRPHFKKILQYAYEVPLLASLKSLLSDPFILEEVLRGHQRQDEILGDYCDGTYYRRHPLYLRDCTSLQIMLYYDDIEVCNPLGSRAKKHKLALFYYTLGNISPKYRSTERCIQLLAVLKSTVLQLHGPDLVLKNFMKDVNKLEQDDGVEFHLNGIRYTFNGTLTIIPGDNLASHYLGGYKCLSSALRKCRVCMAVDDEMQSKFVSEAFQPRTRETHHAHCQSLDGPLHAHYVTTYYGVNRDSILNSSRFFHVTEGLIPDVMHDLLEGALPLVVKELLRHLIDRMIFNHSELMTIMETFPYNGSDLRNKPTPIAKTTLASRDHALKQTATQMRCFGKLLPLMIGEKIEEGDPFWENCLQLLEIVDYCLSPNMCQDWVAYLRMLIDQHHTDFTTLYPSCRITPKMHYIVHYPEIISRYGPLVHFWCMRFEGKHSYFKDLAHRVKCFKNIPKTMAQLHQERVCFNSNGSSPYCKEVETGRVTVSIAGDLTYKDNILALFPHYTERSEIMLLSWVSINGISYKPNLVVVLDMDLLPQFGIIKDIILFNTDVYYLVCELLSTNCFSHHYHSYQAVSNCPVTFCIRRPQCLYDHSLLAAYVMPNSPHTYHIPLKYQLLDND